MNWKDTVGTAVKKHNVPVKEMITLKGPTSYIISKNNNLLVHLKKVITFPGYFFITKFKTWHILGRIYLIHYKTITQAF